MKRWKDEKMKRWKDEKMSLFRNKIWWPEKPIENMSRWVLQKMVSKKGEWNFLMQENGFKMDDKCWIEKKIQDYPRNELWMSGE